MLPFLLICCTFGALSSFLRGIENLFIIIIFLICFIIIIINMCVVQLYENDSANQKVHDTEKLPCICKGKTTCKQNRPQRCMEFPNVEIF